MTDIPSSPVEQDNIIQLYWPKMLRAAAGYEKNLALREELAQEMAMEVWRALKAFSGQCLLNTYIYRVMHNVAVDHVRRMARQPMSDSDEEYGSDLSSPERAYTLAQQQQQLLMALQRLPLSLRQVMLLKLEDVSNGDIAETLGISESNVGVRLNRAKQLLKEWM